MNEARVLQPQEDLNDWHKESDPWNYETSPEDQNRKAILLSEIPKRSYRSVLDIGCGQGFVTRDLPGDRILGVDVSPDAIRHAQKSATERIQYRCMSLFELPQKLEDKFDLIVITGVLYPQYIGSSNRLVYVILDELLADGGTLVSVHIDEWYTARFPYLMVNNLTYNYQRYIHNLEVYVK